MHRFIASIATKPQLMSTMNIPDGHGQERAGKGVEAKGEQGSGDREGDSCVLGSDVIEVETDAVDQPQDTAEGEVTGGGSEREIG